MSRLLELRYNAKNNTIEFRGRNLDAVYPANGHITVAASTDVSDAVDFFLPGSEPLELSVKRLDIQDADTGGKMGVDAAAAVTKLTDEYLNPDVSLTNIADDIYYDPAAMTPGTVLSWDAGGSFTAEVLNAAAVSALADDADLADLNNVSATAPTDGQVLTWNNGNSEWEPADAAGGTTINGLNDVGDVDTTGIADGDGIRYDGTNFVAGKWGVGAENQVIPANEDPNIAGQTNRTIELATSTNPGNAEFFSTTTLDLVDSAGGILERVQVQEVDVGTGPAYYATQNKYGALMLKPTSGGQEPALSFDDTYATAGNVFQLRPGPNYSSWVLRFPDAKSTTTGQVLAVASSSTSLETNLEWVTPATGGGGGNPTYYYEQTCYNSITGTTDAYHWLPGSTVYGFEFYDNNELSTLPTSGYWNRYKKMSHRIPETGTYDLTLTIDIAVAGSTSGNTSASEYNSQDVDVYVYKVSNAGSGAASITQLGTTQAVTMGTSSYFGTEGTVSITGESLTASDRIMVVLKSGVSAVANRYVHWAYDLLAEKTA